MKPSKLDLEIVQGATFRQDLFWYSRPDETSEFSYMDLSGCQLAMQIRPSHKSNTVILDMAQDNYIQLNEPQSGKISLYIPSDITSDLDFSHAVYDIEVTFTNGDVVRFVEGSVTLSPQVTR